ncbi:MAG: winged helix-turn-helix transcriptional regulator [Maritimibacter sp.]|nr:winged helix-turn-helix transcriptional regulator [Maritimibacter sp.]
MTPSEDQPEAQPGTSRAPSPLWPGTTETHRPGGNRGAARRADLRFRLLRALETRPDLSQRGLAEAIGISLGAANALLNAQIAAGLVNIADAATDPARFRIGYVLTEDGRAEMRRLRAPYLARRRAERTVLDAEIAALEAEVAAP